MENNLKTNINTKNDCDGSLKKYKFYKKPPVRNIVPEVKQTKTSIARMLKANPLLKYENSQKDFLYFGTSKNPSIQMSTNMFAPKVSFINFSGNGPKIDHLCNPKISSSIPDRPLFSSTFIVDEEVITKPTTSKVNPPNVKEDMVHGKQPMKRNIKTASSKHDNTKKTLSSQHIDKKRKALCDMMKTGKIGNGRKPPRYFLRRSRSLESFGGKGCYTIKEEVGEKEIGHQLDKSNSQSMQNLIKFNKEPETTFHNGLFHRSNKYLSHEELQPNGKSVIIPNQDYDDENKENIEVDILERGSYDDLRIPDDDVNFKNDRELQRHADNYFNNSKYEETEKTS